MHATGGKQYGFSFFIGNMKASVAIESGSGLHETNRGRRALSRVANMSTECGPKLCSIRSKQACGRRMSV